MTTALKFRNITASPDDPVDTWPFEGILAAVERGTLPDWRRLAAAIRADPWGPVAQQVLEAVRLSRPYGTAELLEGVVDRARKLAADSEREDVASEVREPRRQIRPVEAGFRREDRHLAVSPVDLHVREGRSLGVPDGTDAAGSASCLRGGDPGCRLDIGTAARLDHSCLLSSGSRVRILPGALTCGFTHAAPLA